MLKVCFLLGGFQGNGGIGRVTSILVNELSKNTAFSVSTISYCQTDKPMLYDLPSNVEKFALYNTSISMAKALLFKNAIKKVKTIIKENEIDILIVCGALFYPLGILATKGTSAKCYCWEHTDPSTSFDHKFQNACRKFAVKRADKIILLTKSAQKYYIEKLKTKKEKTFQIYNPVGNEAFSSIEYDANSKNIISVGRLTYQKNFELLIEIAKEILPKFPNWTWDVYGEGELKEKLSKLITTNDLEGKVNLKGQVNDLYLRYKDYSFMVMTSRYEGFPMSLIEGGANKLPLISFDIATGPNEIIDNEINGYLIDAQDKDAMISCIKNLIDNEELRIKMSNNIYKKVQNFNLKEIVKQWEELCKK